MRKGLTQKEFLELEKQAFDKSLDDFKRGRLGHSHLTLSEMYPDPIERIEFLYGPENRPYVRTTSVGMKDDWDDKRLEIATNPEYMDRARESYAFQDLIGREYNGTVFE